MILAINTSTLQFGLALVEPDGTVAAEYLMSKGEGHFGSLLPALHFFFTTSNLDIHDLKGLVTALGPGSFTGLRVGLSFAKGLSHALGVPLIGISSLEAMANQFQHSDLPITAILDSRKGEFFAAQFIWNHDNRLIRKWDDMALKLEAFSSIFEDRTCFIGNDFAGQGPLIREALGPRALLAPAHCWNLKASSVGALGLKRFHARDFDDAQGLSPIYLRPPDIRPNPAPLSP